MPRYGVKSTTFARKSYSTTKSRRAATVAKARGAVKTIQRKTYVPRQVKNTQSVVALSRAVAKLQRSQLGLYQKRFENVQVPPTISAAGWSFDKDHPMCFMANNFMKTNNGTPIYGYGSGAASVGMTEISYFADWQPPNVPSIYHQWDNANDDSVSRTAYLPISATYKFEFNINIAPNDKAFWVRVDVIKPARLLLNSTVHQHMLPHSLPGFANLCTDNMHDRNYINPTYWRHVCKPKFIKLEQHKAATQNSDVRRFYSLNLKFPNKLIRADMDDYADTGENARTNIPLKDQYWVVISQSWNGAMNTTMSRTIRFRDQHGVDA